VLGKAAKRFAALATVEERHAGRYRSALARVAA
jgi:rubrerythrin